MSQKPLTKTQNHPTPQIQSNPSAQPLQKQENTKRITPAADRRGGMQGEPQTQSSSSEKGLRPGERLPRPGSVE